MRSPVLPTLAVGFAPVALWFVLALLFVATGLVTRTVIAILFPSRQPLETTLRPYLGPSLNQGARGSDAPRASVWHRNRTGSALSQRAADVAEEVARQRGLLGSIEHSLERADISLRPGEIIFFAVAGDLLFAVLTGLLIGVPAGVLGLVLGALLPVVVVRRMAKRRLRKFVRQLPDTLTLLSGTLKAGYSLLQGMNAVAQQVEEPMGGELRRTLVEAQLGRPIEQALEECALRMASPDFEWAVMGINIQREVGGNLAELLSTIAETMTERERFRREVKALTAEGKISAILLGGLPPGLGLMMFLGNPGYITPLFTDPTGQTMVGVGAVWALMGFIAMKKIVTIEV